MDITGVEDKAVRRAATAIVDFFIIITSLLVNSLFNPL
jgi:hypothetical protein